MPTFRAARPPSMAQAVATLLSSSPELSGLDQIKVEQAAARTNRDNALSQKALEEVNAMRAQQAFQRDPNNAVRLAAAASGMREPDAMQYERYRRGESEPLLVQKDDEGNAMPPAPYAKPEGITAQQESTHGATLAAMLANLLGTEKSSALELAQSAGKFAENRVRNDSVGLPAGQQNAAVGPYRATAREPFSGGMNAQGRAINQETGDIVNDPSLAALADNLVRQQAYDEEQSGNQRRMMVTEVPRHNMAREGLTARGQNLTNARASGGGNSRSGTKAPAGYRWSDDGEALEPIPGGPKDKQGDGGRGLPGPAITKLAGAGAAVENTQRLTGTFKPEYGGKTLLGDMSNTIGRVFGDETGQAQWWQDMDQLQNQTRHELFGSALTATELKAWEKTSITPRMDPEQIKQNLKRRQEIEARAASKLARAYEAGGYNKQQIGELLGTAAEYLQDPAPPATQRGASGAWGGGPDRRAGEGADRRAAPRAASLAVGTVQDGWRFKGGDPAQRSNWEKVR